MREPFQRVCRLALRGSQNSSRIGTLIRHVFFKVIRLLASFGKTQPVDLLIHPMVEAAFRGLLIPTVGRTTLAEASCLLTLRGAVTLTSIAMRADEEERPASSADAKTLTMKISIGCRHLSGAGRVDSRRLLMPR